MQSKNHEDRHLLKQALALSQLATRPTVTAPEHTSTATGISSASPKEARLQRYTISTPTIHLLAMNNM